MGYKNIPGLYNDEQIEGNIKFTNIIHKYDTKIFAQIYHAGRQSCTWVNGGVQPVAPSAIPCPWLRQLPKELTIPEIKEIIEDFGDCALRVKKSGFDGVEIHGGHGYLIAEFMSSYANKRTDMYGGCLDNRLRIVKEVYENIRSKVGKDFPVTIRFSADESIQGGRDISESGVLAKMFEEWGLDALHVSTGTYGDHNKGIISTFHIGHAWTVDFAAGTPIMSPIKGIEKAHVLKAEDVLVGNVPTGDRIVVAGGGEVGVETAAHLAIQQREVSIVEMLPALCTDLMGILKYNLMKVVDEYEVEKFTSTKVVEILDDGVVIENSNGQLSIPADTVVIALGYKPNNKLSEELKSVHKNVIVVGGAVKTSNALEASRQGFDVGLSIK